MAFVTADMLEGPDVGPSAMLLGQLVDIVGRPDDGAGGPMWGHHPVDLRRAIHTEVTRLLTPYGGATDPDEFEEHYRDAARLLALDLRRCLPMVAAISEASFLRERINEMAAIADSIVAGRRPDDLIHVVSGVSAYMLMHMYPDDGAYVTYALAALRHLHACMLSSPTIMTGVTIPDSPDDDPLQSLDPVADIITPWLVRRAADAMNGLARRLSDRNRRWTRQGATYARRVLYHSMRLFNKAANIREPYSHAYVGPLLLLTNPMMYIYGRIRRREYRVRHTREMAHVARTALDPHQDAIEEQFHAIMSMRIVRELLHIRRYDWTAYRIRCLSIIYNRLTVDRFFPEAVDQHSDEQVMYENGRLGTYIRIIDGEVPDVAPVASPCCSGCGVIESPLRCGSCAVAAYCSRDCAERHWPAHERACPRTRSQ